MTSAPEQPDFQSGVDYWDSVDASVDGVLGGFGNGVSRVSSPDSEVGSERSSLSLTSISSLRDCCSYAFFLSFTHSRLRSRLQCTSDPTIV